MNPETLRVVSQAQKDGKRVVVIADTYYPKSFVEELLKDRNISVSDIFLSSEFRERKDTGGLFKAALEVLKVDPSKVLHIGTKKVGDFEAPKKLGFQALLTTSLMSQYAEASNRSWAFYELNNGSLEASALFGVQALNWANKKFSGQEYGYWEQIGFKIGGPVCYVFAKFIDEYVS